MADYEYGVPFVRQVGRQVIEGLAVFEGEEDARRFAFIQGGNAIFFREASLNAWTEIE